MTSSLLARRAGLILAGGGVYIGASGLVYLYLTTGGRNEADQDSTCCCTHHNVSSFVNHPERAQKFEDIAAKYDFLIDYDEMFMGMGLIRRSLLYWHAKGTVVEVAAGTARNIAYYPSSTVDRVVLTDSSRQMLQQAKQKVMELQLQRKQKQQDNNKPQFALLQADTAKLLDFPDNTFDTVVDTFGLCSFDDPVAALKEMERVCKPNGKILLLEHGRSKTWHWITNHLDQNAERHAQNWGCVWNRDLDRMIQQSGLELDTLHTWHFGTTYYMVCNNSAKTQMQASKANTKSKGKSKE